MQVADFVLARLRGWGVHRVYGYPGDGINGFLGAYDRAGGDPEFIQTRHEEMAAFMACIEHLAFDGLPDPEGGALRPDPARPGLGVDIRWADLAPYRVHGPARPDPARP